MLSLYRVHCIAAAGAVIAVITVITAAAAKVIIMGIKKIP